MKRQITYCGTRCVPGLSLSPSSGRMSSLLGMRLVEKGQSILRTPRRGIPTHASGAAAPGRGAPPGARLFVQQRTSINSTDASAKPARKRFVDWASRAFGAGSTTVAKRSRHPYRWRGGGAPPGCPTCYRLHFSPNFLFRVSRGKSSVRNGPAGSPSVLVRLQVGLLAQA